MSRARDTAGIIQYNKISIDSNNAVGIGSSIPDTKLDVNGGVRVTGIITASSFEGDGSQLSGIDASSLKDGSDIKAQAFGGGVTITGITTTDTLDINSGGVINIADDVVANFGDGSDGRIFFESSPNEFHVRVPGGSGTLTLGAGPAVQITNEDGNTNRAVFTTGGATITGINTADAFAGFDYLQAPHSESTVNFSVTVAAKTTAHRYEGTGSSNGYVINGIESPFLTLTPGITYRFTLSSGDMSSHPFRFYLEADKTTAYTTNVTSTATYTEIEVTDTTPTVLHYQCSSHAYMGNAVQVNSNKVDTPYRIDVAAGGADITGIVTATSFSGDGSALSGIDGTLDTWLYAPG